MFADFAKFAKRAYLPVAGNRTMTKPYSNLDRSSKSMEKASTGAAKNNILQQLSSDQ
jgi:hypothetical protein